MSPSPTSDDSPLARLRAAAAHLHDDVTTSNRDSAPFAAAPAPPADAPPAPAALPAPQAPSWQPPAAAAPPDYAPPVYAPPPAPGPERRTPLVVGGVVAAVLVLALVVVGLVAMSNDGDEAGSQAPPTTQVTPTLAPAPTLIPESQLYAPLTGYTFAPLPEGALEVARGPFEDVPQLRGYLDDLSGRMVMRGGANTAIVFVYQFNDRFAALPGGSDEFIDGITVVSSQVQPVTVAGHEGVYFVYGTSHAGVAVLDGNVAVLVQGPFSTPKSRLEQLTATFLGRV